MSFYSEAREVFNFKEKDFQEITNLPKGFANGTYKNDVCPSLVYSVNIDDGFYVKIYVDYKDMENREIQGTKRYMFDVVTPDYNYTLFVDTWQDVLKISPVSVEICKALFQGENATAKELMDKYDFE